MITEYKDAETVYHTTRTDIQSKYDEVTTRKFRGGVCAEDADGFNHIVVTLLVTDDSNKCTYIVKSPRDQEIISWWGCVEDDDS